MKKIVIALLLMTAIVSCKKTKTDLPSEQTLTGKWELRNTFCGWGGSTNYPAGNGTTITFYGNGQYTSTGLISSSGMYRTSTRTNAQGQIENLIYLDGNWNREMKYSITDNIFKLDENAFIYDGCEYNYRKL